LQEATIDDLGLNFRLNKTKDLPDAQVFDISHSKQFGLCAAFGTEGVYQWNQSQNTWLKLDLDNKGLIYHLFDDREGFFWLSLWQDKLVRVSSTFVKTHDIGTSISTALSRDLSVCGSKILAAYPHKIIAFENGTFSDMTKDQTFEQPINQVLCQSDSELVVNYGNGLFKRINGQWKDISSYKEFINRPVTGISADHNQHLWIALQDGPPIKYDGNSYSLIRSDELEENNRYEFIEASKNGSVWLSSRKTGLIRINGSDIDIIGIEKLPTGKISDLFSDQENNLWFTCQGFGVGLVTPNLEIKLFGEEYGFPQDVRSILVDRKGYLWVGAKNGVFVLKTELALKNEYGYALHIGSNEGLPDDQCLPNQLVEDSEGNIWVATKRGIAEIDSKVALRNSAFIYPKIHIESIKMFFKDVNWRDKGFETDKKTFLPQNLTLQPNENQLSFVVNAVSIQNQQNTFYRYRLNGLEVEFSPVSSGPLITYHDLRPGEYTLVIKPCDVQGICSEEKTRFSFKILKPFYKTWWFYTLLFVLVNGSFFIIIRIRDKSLLRNQQLLEQRVARRTLEIETQKRIIEENNRDITDSIKYAKRIQRAMVPTEKDVKKVFEDSFAIYLPKNIVSGDFFMVNQVNQSKVITVADCTGHGVPGAMMSMLGYGLFLEAIKDKTIETGEAVFNFVSRSVINQLKQNGHEGGSRDGMDASMFIYKNETQEFEFVGAHNSGYLIGDVSFDDETNVIKHQIGTTILYELKANKQPLGINKLGGTAPFISIRGIVKPGTKVYLMTDGYADQFGTKLGEENSGTGKKFRIKRLREKLVEIQDLPMAQQHNELHTTMSIWKGALEQVDDITLIGVKL
jgi:serine phosphatase RsbU (regulator of sigma subunit)